MNVIPICTSTFQQKTDLYSALNGFVATASINSFTYLLSFIYFSNFNRQNKNDPTYLLLGLTDVVQHFVQLWFADQRPHAGAV